MASRNTRGAASKVVEDDEGTKTRRSTRSHTPVAKQRGKNNRQDDTDEEETDLSTPVANRRGNSHNIRIQFDQTPHRNIPQSKKTQPSQNITKPPSSPGAAILTDSEEFTPSETDNETDYFPKQHTANSSAGRPNQGQLQQQQQQGGSLCTKLALFWIAIALLLNLFLVSYYILYNHQPAISNTTTGSGWGFGFGGNVNADDLLKSQNPFTFQKTDHNNLFSQLINTVHHTTQSTTLPFDEKINEDITNIDNYPLMGPFGYFLVGWDTPKGPQTAHFAKVIPSTIISSSQYHTYRDLLTNTILPSIGNTGDDKPVQLYDILKQFGYDQDDQEIDVNDSKKTANDAIIAQTFEILAYNNRLTQYHLVSTLGQLSKLNKSLEDEKAQCGIDKKAFEVENLALLEAKKSLNDQNTKCVAEKDTLTKENTILLNDKKTLGETNATLSESLKKCEAGLKTTQGDCEVELDVLKKSGEKCQDELKHEQNITRTTQSVQNDKKCDTTQFDNKIAQLQKQLLDEQKQCNEKKDKLRQDIEVLNGKNKDILLNFDKSEKMLKENEQKLTKQTTTIVEQDDLITSLQGQLDECKRDQEEQSTNECPPLPPPCEICPEQKKCEICPEQKKCDACPEEKKCDVCPEVKQCDVCPQCPKQEECPSIPPQQESSKVCEEQKPCEECPGQPDVTPLLTQLTALQTQLTDMNQKCQSTAEQLKQCRVEQLEDVMSNKGSEEDKMNTDKCQQFMLYQDEMGESRDPLVKVMISTRYLLKNLISKSNLADAFDGSIIPTNNNDVGVKNDEKVVEKTTSPVLSILKGAIRITPLIVIVVIATIMLVAFQLLLPNITISRLFILILWLFLAFWAILNHMYLSGTVLCSLTIMPFMGLFFPEYTLNMRQDKHNYTIG